MSIWKNCQIMGVFQTFEGNTTTFKFWIQVPFAIPFRFFYQYDFEFFSGIFIIETPLTFQFLQYLLLHIIDGRLFRTLDCNNWCLGRFTTLVTQKRGEIFYYVWLGVGLECNKATPIEHTNLRTFTILS